MASCNASSSRENGSSRWLLRPNKSSSICTRDQNPSSLTRASSTWAKNAQRTEGAVLRLSLSALLSQKKYSGITPQSGGNDWAIVRWISAEARMVFPLPALPCIHTEGAIAPFLEGKASHDWIADSLNTHSHVPDSRIAENLARSSTKLR